ncbi:MAG: hypothetical protein JXA14_03325 [Anaerolineae bacterium]|nr:hypothetical protein [Anaerolineae bacterium]
MITARPEAHGTDDTTQGLAPTPRSLIIEEEYSIPSDLQVPPDDVLRQINFYAAGGGNCGGYHCIDFNDTRVRLSGYDPHQELRVFVYRRTEEVSDPDQPGLVAVGTFVVEWDVSVDSSGFAALDVTGGDPDDFEFIVVDARTGKMLIYSSIAPDNPVSPQWEPGDRVLAYPADVGIDMYAGPGYDQGVVWTVAGGTTVTIVMNPMVGDGERWWLVRLDNGRSGWVAESWLIPIDATKDSLPASTSTAHDTGKEYSIPSGFQVPPGDVFQQITFYLSGGSTGCTRNCTVLGSRELILFGFDANRQLRILVYRNLGPMVLPCDDTEGVFAAVGRYVTEWDAVVDDAGSSTVEVEVTDEEWPWYTFIVLDPLSGEILDKRFTMIGNPLVPEGGLKAGSIVLANTSEEALNVYSEPGYDKVVVGHVSHCEAMTLTGASSLIVGERWWSVQLRDGTEGWISELWIALKEGH